MNISSDEVNFLVYRYLQESDSNESAAPSDDTVLETSNKVGVTDPNRSDVLGTIQSILSKSSTDVVDRLQSAPNPPEQTSSTQQIKSCPHGQEENDRALTLIKECFSDKSIHSKLTCKPGCCIANDNLKYMKGKRQYRFKHSYLSDAKYSFDQTTGIWWLCYIPNDGMFCLLCKHHQQKADQNKSNTVWTQSPCVKVNLDAVRDHNDSNRHRKSVADEMLQRISFFQKELDQKEEFENDSYMKAFNVLYWLAKEQIPTEKFISLIRLLEKIGLDDLRFFAHRSRPSVRDMLLTIGSTVSESLLQEVRQCGSFGILTDEVCDISVKEQLMTFIKYVPSDGIPQTSFLCCEHLDSPNGANAEEIVKKLEKTLFEAKLDTSKMTSFVSDGASVMTGKKSGVGTRLKEKYNKSLLTIHCICHKLALACSDSSNELKPIKNVEELLLSLWKFFEYSPKRTAVLVNIKHNLRAMNLSAQTKDLLGKKIRKACRTRWLSIDEGVKSALENYEAIIQSLRHLDHDPTGAGLLGKIRQVTFLGTLYILQSVLPILSELSKTFQTNALNYSHIEPSIDSCVEKLSSLKDPVLLLKQDLETKWQRLDLTLSEYDEGVLTSRFQKYVLALKANIKSRFEGCVGVLSNFHIFNPSTLPSPSDSEWTNYGKEEIGKLADFFKQGNAEMEKALYEEWNSFKHILFKLKGKFGDTGTKRTLMESTLIHIIQQKKEYTFFYPHILTLIDVILSAAITNAWPERGASCLKRIKTRFRSRITNEILNCLLHININGPDSQSCGDLIKSSLHTWLAEKKRRKLPRKKLPFTQQLKDKNNNFRVKVDVGCQTEDNTPMLLPEEVPEPEAEALCADCGVLTDGIVKAQVRGAERLFALDEGLSDESDYDSGLDSDY